MEISFVGKTALVTGAGKGIGRATAKLLAKCGANVIALTRTQSDLDSLKKEIPNLQTICVDILNLDEAIQAVKKAGQIDLLVNNAASTIKKKPMDLTRDDMEEVMLTNVTAPLMLSQVVARKLIEAGKPGAIVNISTLWTHGAPPGTSPYVCSKAALESLTMALAIELAPHKIRVNSVLPGAINTPLLQSGEFTKEMESAHLARTPMGRIGEPEEIAHAIAFLLSDKASYTTGQGMISDGGYTAR